MCVSTKKINWKVAPQKNSSFNCKKIMLIEIKLLLHHIQAFGENMLTKA